MTTKVVGGRETMEAHDFLFFPCLVIFWVVVLAIDLVLGISDSAVVSQLEVMVLFMVFCSFFFVLQHQSQEHDWDSF